MAIYGVDLGTTFCSVACVVDGRVDVLPLEAGRPTLASLVMFDGRGAPSAVVGTSASRRYRTIVGEAERAPDGLSLVRGAKNFIGVSAKVPAGPPWRVGAHALYATDVSAVLLRALAEMIRAQPGAAPVDGFVISHPQRFRNREKLATAQAARLAGVRLAGMITEPDAAAWAYGVVAAGEDGARPRTFMVFDFGGGTLDVTIMRVESAEGGRPRLRALDSYGIQLGGLAMDERVRDALAAQYAARADDPGFRLDLVNEATRERLLELAEGFKISLNTDAGSDPSPLARVRSKRFTPVVDEFTEGDEVTLSLSLGELAKILGGDLDRAMACADEALRRASMPWSSLDEVLLTGGSSLLWPLQQRMRERVERVRIFDDPRHPLNPLTVVASGAALYAASLSGDEPAISMRGVVPDTFSIRAYTPDPSAPGGRRATLHPLIPAGTPTPFVGRAQFVKRGDGATLPVEVFEGRSEREATRVGVYVIAFDEQLPDGARVDVTLDVRANGALVLGVRDAASGALREAALDEAPGLYADAELDARTAWLQQLQVDWSR